MSSNITIQKGFTLIEVSLAVSMVAVGLLTIFALFPIGLRESEYAVQDTQEAMFADSILSVIEGNAMAIDDWNIWLSLTDGTLPVDLLEGVYPKIPKMVNTEINKGIEFPVPSSGEQGNPRSMRYSIKISGEPGDDRLRIVELWALSNRYGDFNTKAKYFYTKIYYMGM